VILVSGVRLAFDLDAFRVPFRGGIALRLLLRVLTILDLMRFAHVKIKERHEKELSGFGFLIGSKGGIYLCKSALFSTAFWGGL